MPDPVRRRSAAGDRDRPTVGATAAAARRAVESETVEGGWAPQGRAGAGCRVPGAGCRYALRSPARLSRAIRLTDLCPLPSALCPLPSALRPPTSDLRPPTSDLRPPTSDLRPLFHLLAVLWLGRFFGVSGGFGLGGYFGCRGGRLLLGLLLASSRLCFLLGGLQSLDDLQLRFGLGLESQL
jgi:hypothetical protein